ncbi:MAG TPA: AAA family ATPase, partial [Nitrospira sp.]|nr:AAA family ATPase [Nitrospira sp.]
MYQYDDQLWGGFEGYRNSVEKFTSKVLREHASNTATLLTLEELETKAQSIFGPTPTAETPAPAVDISKLLEHETNLILKKRVIGKDDVDITAMIKKLSNSDWVREGRSFY